MQKKTDDEIEGRAVQQELPGIEPRKPELTPMEATELMFKLARLRDDLDLIPVEHVAPLLNVQEQTLAGWRSGGFGPSYVKLGKNVFYRRAHLKSWIDENTVEPGEVKEAA